MRPFCAEVDLDAIISNFQLANELSRKSVVSAQTLAVVKGNAYGHGAVKVAAALEPYAPAFAVSSCDEAVIIRDGGILKPILLLQGIFSEEELSLCVARNFWPMIVNIEQVETLMTAKLAHRANVWLKLDTGMHRLGIEPGRFREVLPTASMQQ